MTGGLLIGLYSPQPGAGKTTLAEALERDLNAERIRFAGPLKAMLAGLLREVGADEARIHEMLDGSLKELPARELLGRTPRYAMQRLGSEWGRELMHENIWTELLRLRAAPPLGAAVVEHVHAARRRAPREEARRRDERREHERRRRGERE